MGAIGNSAKRNSARAHAKNLLDTMMTTTSHTDDAFYLFLQKQKIVTSNPRAVFDKLTGAELCNRSVRALGSGLQLPARLAEPRRLLARRRGPQARTGDARGGESARVLTPRPHYCSARRFVASIFSKKIRKIHVDMQFFSEHEIFLLFGKKSHVRKKIAC